MTAEARSTELEWTDPESDEERAERERATRCDVCGGYGSVRAECGPPYFMIPCWGCKGRK